MSRYQIYLEPNTVAAIDGLSSDIGVSRSQVIRDVLDRVAREYRKVLLSITTARKPHNPVLRMIGAGKSASGNLSRTVDMIYLRD